MERRFPLITCFTVFFWISIVAGFELSTEVLL
jgi:hypothetical protein